MAQRRYEVLFCPGGLFSRGATFTSSDFRGTLAIQAWPEGTIFLDRKRQIVVRVRKTTAVAVGDDCLIKEHERCCCSCKHQAEDLFHPDNSTKSKWFKRRGWVCLAPGRPEVFSSMEKHGICERWEST